VTLKIEDVIQKTITSYNDKIVDLSHRIWDNPETAFEEEKSSRWTAQLLSEFGYQITTGVADLPTAFSGEIGSGPLTIGICAELDALPGIGHACGHNMIAASAVAAAIGLASVADDLGITIRILGTPAEEVGGGKILMLERGAFDGVHMAMMVHPSPNEADLFPTLAINQCDFHFKGKTAHASVTPNLGINAADGITVSQVALGLLRQHLEPGDQIHGIVTNGGEAPNIVPGNATARYFMRAPTLEALKELQPRVNNCFEAGALATGSELQIESLGPPYSEFMHDYELADLYRKNASMIGRKAGKPSNVAAGSTDMANISLLIPTIHPMLGLDCFPAVNHQPEFAQYCVTTAADETLMQGGIAMALTASDAAKKSEVSSRLVDADTSYSAFAEYPWTF